MILIAEHSFYLSQKNDPRPFSTAAQLYKASDIPARVQMALEEVVKQYGKLSDKEKVDMLSNIILQNHRGSLMSLSRFYKVLFTNTSISDIQAIE